LDFLKNVNLFSYEQYKELAEKLLASGKTTGDMQTPEIIEYTKLNMHRMKRWEKETHIIEPMETFMKSLKEDYLWMVISEAWCGDAANIVPVLQKIAELSPHIELKIVLRDDNPEIMDRYLTNGTRSIPKLICFRKNDSKEIFVWGPRPEALQKILTEAKSKSDFSFEDFKQKIQLWYADNKSIDIQKEILNKFKSGIAENNNS